MSQPRHRLPDAVRAVETAVSVRIAYVGAEGLREFVRDWVENWTDWKLRLEEVVYADDNRAVAVLHQSAVGRTSGAPVQLRFAQVLTFRDGQIVDRHDYRDTTAAFEALGLTE